MKKLVLLFTGMLMGLTSVSATAETSADKGKRLEITKRYREMQPILFVERGVEFMIFPDGSFDFNTNYGRQAYTRPKSRRSSINTTFGAPGTKVRFSERRSSGVLITHDRDGKVRRIGNVFINYDGRDRVKRIGSVYMKYGKKRFGQLKQVGGLKLKYNRWGKLLHMQGHVNHSNQGCGICGTSSCSMNHFDHHDNDWDDHGDDWDDDDYYYRNNKKSKKSLKKLRRS